MYICIYVYKYTRRKDGAKAPSLLDLFGHFGAKADSSQSVGAAWNADPRPWISVTSVLKLTALKSSKTYAKIHQKSMKIIHQK